MKEGQNLDPSPPGLHPSPQYRCRSGIKGSTQLPTPPIDEGNPPVSRELEFTGPSFPRETPCLAPLPSPGDSAQPHPLSQGSSVGGSLWVFPEEGGVSNLASEQFSLHRNWKASQVPQHVSPQPLRGISSHSLALGQADLREGLQGKGSLSFRSGALNPQSKSRPQLPAHCALRPRYPPRDAH